ncbi:hypothetical protein QVD17_03672 [Tagetes erecta]|uniref:Uncharacterized protein n=1 Tax=Tagetes erecta TaxID=13708 RepID=A0AAD8LAE3_TARER|nr:hypothetical protein QVD17_03672 [Tagetes erecta]
MKQCTITSNPRSYILDMSQNELYHIALYGLYNFLLFESPINTMLISGVRTPLKSSSRSATVCVCLNHVVTWELTEST